tara:strand:- start:568 stop:699 length:132 start_codon:yes stop_codon:yes gene_type:complete
MLEKYVRGISSEEEDGRRSKESPNLQFSQGPNIQKIYGHSFEL